LASAAVLGALDPGGDRDPEFVAGRPVSTVKDVFCSRLNKLSMAALSPAEPTWPIEPSM